MATVRDLSGNAPFAAPDRNISDVTGIARSYDVTPSDSVDLPNGVCAALSVAAAGDVKITYASGVTSTTYLQAGIWHPMDVTRVWSTGTTATGVEAGYT